MYYLIYVYWMLLTELLNSPPIIYYFHVRRLLAGHFCCTLGTFSFGCNRHFCYYVCRTSLRGVLRGFFLSRKGVEESLPSCWGSIRKPSCTGLVRDSKVRDWLCKGKVLAPLVCLTWSKLHCVFWYDFHRFDESYLFMWINLAFEILL